MFFVPVCEVPLSSVSLSFEAESGSLSRSLGLTPSRTQMPPRGEPIPIYSVRYVYPALPSAGRAAPLRRA